MSNRVLLISDEMGLGYKRGIYYYSKSLIKAIKMYHQVGLLTHAYENKSSEILESLNDVSHYFYKKYEINNRWGFYLKYLLNLRNDFDFTVNNHSIIVDGYSDSIDFFINKPVFYYYNQQYLKIPGVSLHDLNFYDLNEKDVIVTTNPVNVRSSKNKIIQTLHDVFPLSREGKYYQREFHKKLYGVTTADKIIAVSKYAKESFLNFYPYLEDKIEVVYQSISIDANLIEQSKDIHLNAMILNKYGLESKAYMFFVGAIEYRKNIHNLVQAYKIATKGNDGLKLVIAGRADDPKYLNEFGLLDYIQGHNIENIQFIGEISNLEKICLIKNSRAFLFPSLLEGFGIPVVEAQTLGVPVLTSNNSALTEVAGNSAFLVENPEDLEELADGIRQLWNDDELCCDLCNKGFENIKRFSFDTFSTNVNRIIDSI